MIRREVYLNEGDVFNTELLKQSIRRVNQLGYFKPMEGVPRLTPSPGQDDKLDVTFQVEEQNRTGHNMRPVARLAEGVSLDEANEELSRITEQLARVREWEANGTLPPIPGQP